MRAKLGRVQNVRAWEWRCGKNRETVTVSFCLAFTELVTPATTTPDWSKGQWSSSERSKALTTRVTESDIHHIAVQAKMFWFWSSVCFLSWRKRRRCFSFTGSFSILWIQFNTKMYFHTMCRQILSTPALSGILKRFSVEISDWNFEINATKTARTWTCGLWPFFTVREEFFRPAFNSLDST